MSLLVHRAAALKRYATSDELSAASVETRSAGFARPVGAVRPVRAVGSAGSAAPIGTAGAARTVNRIDDLRLLRRHVDDVPRKSVARDGAAVVTVHDLDRMHDLDNLRMKNIPHDLDRGIDNRSSRAKRFAGQVNQHLS